MEGRIGPRLRIECCAEPITSHYITSVYPSYDEAFALLITDQAGSGG